MSSEHLLVELEIGTALVQTVGVLLELLVARRLHLAEEVQRTVGDVFALLQTFARIVQLVAAQHVFLRVCVCMAREAQQTVVSLRLGKPKQIT